MEKKWCHYFEGREWIFFTVVILTGLALRWTYLDERPFHHDESLYAMFGKYSFTDPDIRFYQYNPLLHGPLLFNLLPMVFQIFGVSNWSPRMPMALLGSFFLFVPFLFRKWFHPWGVLTVTTLLALSPSFIYWSRFVGHDLLVLFSFFLMLFGAVRASSSWKAIFVLGGLSLQFCIKENAYVTVAIFLGFFLFEYFFKIFVFRERNHLFKKLWLQVKNHPMSFALAAGLAIFLYCYLYSAGFKYPKGILDGLYRESLSYWMNQHLIERIKGPFFFHLFAMAWYDFIFFIFFVVYFFLFYARAPRPYLYSLLVVLAASSVIFFTNRGDRFATSFVWFWGLFKGKIPMDAFGPLILIFHSFAVTIYHLKRREEHLAFFGYLFFSYFFTYSFLGEKVPWLTLYIFIPGVVYLWIYFENLFREVLLFLPEDGEERRRERKWEILERVIFRSMIVLYAISTIITYQDSWREGLSWFLVGSLLLGFLLVLKGKRNWVTQVFPPGFPWAYLPLGVIFLFNLKMSILTNFSKAGMETEFISQVHTTRVFQELGMKIRDQIQVPLSGKRPKVLTLDDPIWPMTWYMRDLPEFSFSHFPAQEPLFDYIIKRSFNSPELSESHYLLALPLRGWWVPDYDKMNLHHFLQYAFDHNPWNNPGYLFITYARKKNP